MRMNVLWEPILVPTVVHVSTQLALTPAIVLALGIVDRIVLQVTFDHFIVLTLCLCLRVQRLPCRGSKIDTSHMLDDL